MQPTLRTLARLTAGAQTGLTGLPTHATPRSALLFLYAKILDRIKALPESSLYRQSVERTTLHRQSLVKSIEPEGYVEWAKRTREVIAKYPDVFRVSSWKSDGAGAHTVRFDSGEWFVILEAQKEVDIRRQEWDGVVDEVINADRVPSPEEQLAQMNKSIKQAMGEDKPVDLEPEPVLTAEQVEELEKKIGAGLIEEVIQVAEGELHAIDVMEQAKVWEPLEEQPVPGQWTYFERPQ